MKVRSMNPISINLKQLSADGQSSETGKIRVLRNVESNIIRTTLYFQDKGIEEKKKICWKIFCL